MAWTREDFEAFAAFIPILEARDFKPCEWKGFDKLPNGSLMAPYVVYHEDVDRLFALASKDFLPPYDLLPEDPPGTDLHSMRFTPEYFENATLDQLRRYFLLIRRRERFCDGYIEDLIKDGTMTAALRRLVELA
jgi:hypothetical protein